MKKLILLVSSMVFLQACSVSDKVISNHGLYCSDIYRGIRATARVASEIAVGISTPDLCESIAEIVSEERGEADATDKSDTESGSSN